MPGSPASLFSGLRRCPLGGLHTGCSLHHPWCGHCHRVLQSEGSRLNEGLNSESWASGEGQGCYPSPPLRSCCRQTRFPRAAREWAGRGRSTGLDCWFRGGGGGCGRLGRGEGPAPCLALSGHPTPHFWGGHIQGGQRAPSLALACLGFPSWL